MNILENEKTLLEDVALPIHWIINLHRQCVSEAILNDAENLRIVKVN